jgi:pyridoxine 4-dehydrogenase
VICTKVGCARKPDKSWIPFNKPENLRASIEKNLRTLKIDRVTLVHFRAMGTHMNFEAGMDTMFSMQREGKILHVGVSNVSKENLQTALKMGNIATVENMYGHAQRTTVKQAYGETHGGEVLEDCEERGLPFVPFFSLLHGLEKKDRRIREMAKKYLVSEAQINIAWLLHKSPWILPIPGTSSLQHFEENIKAADIELSEDDMKYLE